jgi:dipeptidyl aminopeptidase/acylaminoacyl peptidase
MIATRTAGGLALALTFLVLAWSNPAAAANPMDAACVDLLQPTSLTIHVPRRDVIIDDLVRLRDMGSGHLGDLDRAMSISPDGRQAAFILSRGDPRSNQTCEALILVDIANGSARILDTGGEPDLSLSTIRGLYNPSGLPASDIPVWSPDGRWLVFLKREGQVTRAWRVSTLSGDSIPISQPVLDIEMVGWANAGQSIVTAGREVRTRVLAAQDAEARRGYLFDDRFATYTGNVPLLRANLPLNFSAFDLESGAIREASAAERKAIYSPPALDSQTRALLSARSADGRAAWSAQDTPNDWMSSVAIWATDRRGHRVRCSEAPCIGGTLEHLITGLWLSRDQQHVIWLRRTGWGDSEMALYQWEPGGSVRPILQTRDELIDCHMVQRGLLCFHESSLRPRSLVLIDLATGKWRTIFDPNPTWSTLRSGEVRRLYWRNDLGFETFGDLVLPPGYRGEGRLPLIIVQYHSRGFLRGGTGDEVPIRLFAERGYAVLCFNMPQFFATSVAGSHLPTPADIERANTRGWRQRRSILSSLVEGIDLVVGMGIVDRARIGLTGLSDGSTTAQFALINAPNLFAAASVSACCVEPGVMMTFGGTALGDERRAWGYPDPEGDGRKAWQPIAFSMNASRIRAPLLISNGDNEYLLGIETFMALRAAGKPVEMRIYPNEYHLKWQPAHRQALYERNLAWFDFWLLHREDRCIASPEEYRRWEEMPGAPSRESMTVQGNSDGTCDPVS